MKKLILTAAILFLGTFFLKAQFDTETEDFGNKASDMMLRDELGDFFHYINSGMTTPEDIRFLKSLETEYRDTLTISRVFSDKNGKNHLEIIVYDNCNDTLEVGEGYRADGMINCVTAHISNKKGSDSLRYYNPDVMMSLLYLKEKNIVTKNIAGKTAVFAPMIYCGNADVAIWVSYILAYDGKVYLKHIHAQSPEGGFDNYQLYDNLDEKLKDLPEKLKKEFINLLENTVFDDLWDN